MVELIKHLLGLCPDHMTHLNVFDALFGTGLIAFAGGYFTRIKGIFVRKNAKPPVTPDDEPKP
jgi:hypothetical protein